MTKAELKDEVPKTKNETVNVCLVFHVSYLETDLFHFFFPVLVFYFGVLFLFVVG